MNIRKLSMIDEVTDESLENDSFCSVIKNGIKLRYDYVSSLRVPTCYYILLYIFVCFFGNIITGIFLCKHHLASYETENDLGALTIKLQDNNNISLKNLDINTTLQDVVADSIKNAEKDDVADSTKNTEKEDVLKYLSYFNESKAEVSQNLII